MPKIPKKERKKDKKIAPENGKNETKKKEETVASVYKASYKNGSSWCDYIFGPYICSWIPPDDWK